MAKAVSRKTRRVFGNLFSFYVSDQASQQQFTQMMMGKLKRYGKRYGR